MAPLQFPYSLLHQHKPGRENLVVQDGLLQILGQEVRDLHHVVIPFILEFGYQLVHEEHRANAGTQGRWRHHRGAVRAEGNNDIIMM
jgi:hypothetical protein